ncbi:MAG TPA: hypothetical protein VGO80_20770 [Solirubrobacteraceae bacterium]|jgi:uncharacterized protein with GYD domain|nr:hypothetical protein [Solirubrobacteraceae bacterium]
MENTYVILCDFSSQDGLEQLIAGGDTLREHAANLGAELREEVHVDALYLTRGGGHDVVLIVKAPSDERALESRRLFDDMGDVEMKVLTVTPDVAGDIVTAFNGHTKV